jgi:glycosyltransferase involved in cell wall biosynthesis
LIHELSTIVERNHGVDRYNAIARCSRHVVFPNSYVKAQIEEAFGVADGAVHVIPQGLYSKTSIDATDVSGRIKQKLGIPEESFIVVNTGYADLRKGVDLFVDLSQRVSSLDSRIHFVWLGNIDPVVDAWIVNDVRRGRFRNLHFVGFVDDVTSVLNSADLFFLSSREDPFPSAVLEATSVGLPVASFDTGGGYVDFIKGNPLVGFLVPSDDLDASAQIICNAIYSDEINDARSISYRRALIETDYDFRSYCFNIVNLLKTNLKISVIVPNYNYRSYLRDRLQSIFEQTYPVFEIIVLDDCSTDGSLQELDSISLDVNRDFRIVANDVNSGNVFAQWRRGINACKGDFVWIAEADDLADPTFLERLIPLVSADNVGMAFTDSRTVDEGGLLQWNTYKSYYSTLFPGALSESAIFDGATFFRDYLSVKNVIMNVSSVLWRKSALDRALDGCGADLRKFQMAGDWRVYAEICSLGHRVGYEAQPLNVHRRHSNSVTHSLKRELHRDEIAIMHDLARRRLGRAAPRDVQRAYLDEIVAQFGIAD